VGTSWKRNGAVLAIVASGSPLRSVVGRREGGKVAVRDLLLHVRGQTSSTACSCKSNASRINGLAEVIAAVVDAAREGLVFGTIGTT
jgi:hypothetical protein